MSFEREFIITMFVISCILATLTVLTCGKMQDSQDENVKLKADIKALKILNKDLSERVFDVTDH